MKYKNQNGLTNLYYQKTLVNFENGRIENYDILTGVLFKTQSVRLQF